MDMRWTINRQVLIGYGIGLGIFILFGWQVESLREEPFFWGMLGVLLIWSGVLLGWIWGNIQKSMEQMERSENQLDTSLGQARKISETQQEKANAIAVTTSEACTTVQKMVATSSELLSAADTMHEVSRTVSRLAGTGKEALQRMEKIRSQTREAAGVINTRLDEVNDKAGNIHAVVTTITKVADQTNLLSLNAAIEAEKAGEYGKGFGVVAREIRRLADQTAASTLDIELIVREMLESVSAGVSEMEKFSDEVRRSDLEVQEVNVQLDQLIGEVRRIEPGIESMYQGMQTQSQGANQIQQALLQLEEGVRNAVGSVKDSHQVVAQLDEAREVLRKAIKNLKSD